ncbi:MAG: DUF502 domain-containing protein [Bacillota bacterium]
MKRLRTFFLAGLIAITPAAVTYLVLRWLFFTVDGLFGAPFDDFVYRQYGFRVPGIGLLVTLLVILLTGVLATNLLGRQLLGYVEEWLQKLPLVRSVYATMRQLTDAFLAQDQTAFKRVAMVEYPRRGSWGVGFITGEVAGGPMGLTQGETYYNVFLPTTPNPTSGFLLILPASEVRLLDISVEDGLKLVISGGVVVPESLVAPQSILEAAPGSE